MRLILHGAGRLRLMIKLLKSSQQRSDLMRERTLGAASPDSPYFVSRIHSYSNSILAHSQASYNSAPTASAGPPACRRDAWKYYRPEPVPDPSSVARFNDMRALLCTHSASIVHSTIVNKSSTPWHATLAYTLPLSHDAVIYWLAKNTYGKLMERR